MGDKRAKDYEGVYWHALARMVRDFDAYDGNGSLRRRRLLSSTASAAFLTSWVTISYIVKVPLTTKYHDHALNAQQ